MEFKITSTIANTALLNIFIATFEAVERRVILSYLYRKASGSKGMRLSLSILVFLVRRSVVGGIRVVVGAGASLDSANVVAWDSIGGSAAADLIPTNDVTSIRLCLSSIYSLCAP